jgi:hypothetical protein
MYLSLLFHQNPQKKKYPSCTYSTPDTAGAGLRGLDVDSVNSSSDYFAYVCIPAIEATLHQKRTLLTSSHGLDYCSIVYASAIVLPFLIYTLTPQSLQLDVSGIF